MYSQGLNITLYSLCLHSSQIKVTAFLKNCSCPVSAGKCALWSYLTSRDYTINTFLHSHQTGCSHILIHNVTTSTQTHTITHTHYVSSVILFVGSNEASTHFTCHKLLSLHLLTISAVKSASTILYEATLWLFCVFNCFKKMKVEI